MDLSKILNADYKKMNISEILNPDTGKGIVGNSLQASQMAITSLESTFTQDDQTSAEIDSDAFLLEDQRGVDARSSRQTPDKTFTDYELQTLGKYERSAIKYITMTWVKKNAGLLYLKRAGDWKVACYSWWNYLLANYARASEIETWEKARIQDTYLALGRALNPKERRPKRETMADNKPSGRVEPLASLTSCQSGCAHPDGGETFDTSKDDEATERNRKELGKEREELKREREDITRQRKEIARKWEQIRGEREEIQRERGEMKKERAVFEKFGEALKRYTEDLEKHTTGMK
ncbi:hypothetical protein EAF04_005023 [Stromatinia cepivora]|nr:hypothetical protein EAF04_005023 [Stromatinia cepivora]